MGDLTHRIESLDWPRIGASLDERGYATAALLTSDECADLIALYPDETRFRKRIDMARLRFGIGEYKYFASPLPEIVQEMRAVFYPLVVPIANRWMKEMRAAPLFPPTLAGLRALCARHGQTEPTPLMLHYEAGGYNCLHQDLYGEVAFPIQITCVLSRLGIDYEGGEFLLVEQRPRSQSRGEAITLGRGEAIMFANRHRPVRGRRGSYRVNVRHGVSTLRSGQRFSLGVIFHDAK
jgi:uncharacterized protein